VLSGGEKGAGEYEEGVGVERGRKRWFVVARRVRLNWGLLAVYSCERCESVPLLCGRGDGWTFRTRSWERFKIFEGSVVGEN